MAEHDLASHQAIGKVDICTVWCPAHPNHWQTQPKQVTPATLGGGLAAVLGEVLDRHVGWQMHRGQMVDELTAACLAHLQALAVVEWNVLDDGEPYLQPWTEDEHEARSYLTGVTGPLVRRIRVRFADLVSDWESE